MSQPSSPGLKKAMDTAVEIESKTKSAINLVKSSFSDLKKEFNDSRVHIT